MPELWPTIAGDLPKEQFDMCYKMYTEIPSQVSHNRVFTVPFRYVLLVNSVYFSDLLFPSID